ncbi:MAG: hypothetical protein CMO55_21825 [Verrucomicrobiales bacterium]|nr:hypothetical protein [Verrucomicrobiales bacterium]
MEAISRYWCVFLALITLMVSGDCIAMTRFDSVKALLQGIFLCRWVQLIEVTISPEAASELDRMDGVYREIPLFNEMHPAMSRRHRKKILEHWHMLALTQPIAEPPEDIFGLEGWDLKRAKWRLSMNMAFQGGRALSEDAIPIGHSGAAIELAPALRRLEGIKGVKVKSRKYVVREGVEVKAEANDFQVPSSFTWAGGYGGFWPVVFDNRGESIVGNGRRDVFGMADSGILPIGFWSTVETGSDGGRTVSIQCAHFADFRVPYSLAMLDAVVLLIFVTFAVGWRHQWRAVVAAGTIYLAVALFDGFPMWFPRFYPGEMMWRDLVPSCILRVVLLSGAWVLIRGYPTTKSRFAFVSVLSVSGAFLFSIFSGPLVGMIPAAPVTKARYTLSRAWLKVGEGPSELTPIQYLQNRGIDMEVVEIDSGRSTTYDVGVNIVGTRDRIYQFNTLCHPNVLGRGLPFTIFVRAWSGSVGGTETSAMLQGSESVCEDGFEVVKIDAERFAELYSILPRSPDRLKSPSSEGFNTIREKALELNEGTHSVRAWIYPTGKHYAVEFRRLTGNESNSIRISYPLVSSDIHEKRYCAIRKSSVGDSVKLILFEISVLDPAGMPLPGAE